MRRLCLHAGFDGWGALPMTGSCMLAVVRVAFDLGATFRRLQWFCSLWFARMECNLLFRPNLTCWCVVFASNRTEYYARLEWFLLNATPRRISPVQKISFRLPGWTGLRFQGFSYPPTRAECRSPWQHGRAQIFSNLGPRGMAFNQFIWLQTGIQKLPFNSKIRFSCSALLDFVFRLEKSRYTG
jgi:hypothetical protein